MDLKEIRDFLHRYTRKHPKDGPHFVAIFADGSGDLRNAYGDYLDDWANEGEMEEKLSKLVSNE